MKLAAEETVAIVRSHEKLPHWRTCVGAVGSPGLAVSRWLSHSWGWASTPVCSRCETSGVDHSLGMFGVVAASSQSCAASSRPNKPPSGEASSRVWIGSRLARAAFTTNCVATSTSASRSRRAIAGESVHRMQHSLRTRVAENFSKQQNGARSV